MSAFSDPEIYRTALESVPTGLCMIDQQKRVTAWSAGAEQLTGRLRHEVIGHSCVNEALLQCDQPGCEFCNEECPLARAMKVGQPVEAIGFLHHKQGHEIPVRLRAVPVRNAHGSIVGALETFEEQRVASHDQRQDTMDVPGCMDEVTLLASQTMMRSRLRDTLTTFHEVHVPFAVLLARPAGFEHFRASFGPEAASMLLRAFARTLEGALWRTDFVGRWGEDEFLMILNGCSDQSMHAVRDRVHRLLAENAIEWWGERRSLPVSIGLAAAQAEDSVESLMARAHQCLDAASSGLARGAASNHSSSSGS